MTTSNPPAWVTRNLVVCDGGPWDGRWFFLEDFRAVRASAEHMAAAGQQGTYPALAYEATTQKREHPKQPALGTVARYTSSGRR